MTAVSLPQDNRGFFMVPQFYEGGGYYTYGTPDQGAGQYAHPNLMTFLMKVANNWCAIDNRKFGVGNISLAGGSRYPGHASHRSGLDLDIRPLRKDGLRQAVWCTSSDYDHEGTARLVELMWNTGMVSMIFFNDRNIPRMQRLAGHDNHLHLTLRSV